MSCVSGSTATAGCTPSTLMGGPRALVMRPNGLQVWVAASRADSVVTLQIDPVTGILAPTAGLGGCLRRLASSDCRAARALDDPRGLASSADGSHVYAVSAQSDGIAVLGPQLAPNCLRVRATTVANKAHSVVLACSDPNGDKIALTSRQPAEARAGDRPRQGDRQHPLHPGSRLHGRRLVHVHGHRRPRHQRARYRDRERDAAAQGAARPHPAPHARICCPAGASTCSWNARPSPSGPAGSRCTCSSRAGARATASRRVVRRATGRVVTARGRGEGTHQGPGRGHRARQDAPRDDRPAEHPDPALASLFRTGFKSGGAFGDLESPAVCQSGAVVVLLVAGGRPTARPAATLCPLKEPS